MTSSRRDFLVAMLGAAALPSCKRFREVPGSVLGGSVEVGHKLRDVPSLGPPQRTEHVPVLIIGAGPSGLSAAWRLERLGEPRYLLLDLEDREGGTSRYGTDAIVKYPWGAHYLPLPRKDNAALLSLLREVGAVVGEDDRGRPIPDEGTVVRDPEERVFWDGEWRDGLYLREGASAADLDELRRFQIEIAELAARRDDKGKRAFELPLERGSSSLDVRQLDTIPMSEWMDRRGFKSSRLRWLVAYACRDDYGLLPSQTSAWAGIFYFASRLEGPGEEAALLLSWTNGNGRLVEHLASTCNDRIRARHLVVDVVTEEDRVVCTALDLIRGDVVQFIADRVIFAAPKMLAPRVLRTLRDTRPSWCDSFVYGAWMVANIHLDAHPRGQGAPLAWDNVLYDSPSLGYVVATHQAHVDSGPTVLTYYYAYTDPDAAAGRRLLYQGDHASFVDMILSDLRPAHPTLHRQVQKIDVWRWGHAMVQPRVGFVWGEARKQAQLPIGRVHMAHSDLSGMALFEEAFHHGIRAAEEVFLALPRPTAPVIIRLAE